MGTENQEKRAAKVMVDEASDIPVRQITGGRILVVDDDAQIVEVLQDALAAEGYEVDTASNAREALELIQASIYDAAILDFHLPDMNGVMLHSQIRQMDKELATRTIFISGLVQSQSNRSYYASEGAGFLPKPFRLQDVLDTIRRLLERAA